ncbi:hypothetical protein D3C81_1352960 [compost metagenome]
MVDLRPGRGRHRRRRLALGGRGQQAAPHHHVLAHRQPRAGLLLVAQQRQVGIEQVVGCLALAGGREAHHVAEHVREAVARVGAVGAAFHLVVEEQAVVAAEDRDMAHRAILFEAAQRRDLFQPGPVLVLEHHAGGQFLHDAADHAGRHLHREGQRIVLDHERHVRADGLHGLAVIADDLVIRAQRVGRGDHHARRAALHHFAGQRAHGGKPWRRHPHHHRQSPRPADHLRGHLHGFGMFQLGRLAQLAQHGNAGGATGQVKVGQAVDRGDVDRAIVEERRRGDGEDAACVSGQRGESGGRHGGSWMDSQGKRASG